MADLAYWVFQNPPPVHFFLISSDSDFAYILHRLRMSNYNILLASTDTAQGVLCSSATIMWNWPCLVKGEENLMVKHFNYPPDGVNGSWYGHYRGSLDDPYAEMSQVENFQMVDCEELISPTNNHAIPNAVIDAISKILRSCPEGIYLSILRSRLERNNISLSKNFFGYKRFSQLLASLPDLVKIKNPQNGKNEPMVCLAEKALAKSLDLSSKPVRIENKEKGNVPSNNSQSTPVFPPRTPNGYLDFSPQFDASKDSSTNNSVPSVEHKSFDKQELVCSKNNYMDANFSTTTLTPDDKIAVKEGLLRRILRILIGPRSKVSNADLDSVSKKDSPDADFKGYSVPVIDSGLEKTIGQRQKAHWQSKR